MCISGIFVSKYCDIYFNINPLPFFGNTRDKSMRAQYNLNGTLKIGSIGIPPLVFFVKLCFCFFLVSNWNHYVMQLLLFNVDVCLGFTTCFCELSSVCYLPRYSKLKKLSEDSLTKQPEEVFDVLEKLGEG